MQSMPHSSIGPRQGRTPAMEKWCATESVGEVIDMKRTPCMLALLLIPTVVFAQTVRTGGLDNLALGAEVEASSAAGPVDGKYGPPKAVDGDSNTRWASADGAPPPQWLELTFAEPITLDTIVLAQSSMERLYANAQRIELAFSEGDPLEFELEDTWAQQLIRFEARETTSLRLTILSAYELKNYLGIDELALYHDADRMVQTVMPPRQRWDDPDLTAHGREVHPCVNKLPEDVERARENVARYPFLADYVAGMQESADEWLERSDEWLMEMLPEPGAAFAYGFTAVSYTHLTLPTN